MDEIILLQVNQMLPFQIFFKKVSLAGYRPHHPHLETSRALYCSSVSKIAASVQAVTFSEGSRQISLELEVMHLLILNKQLEENFAQFHLAGIWGSCFYTCRKEASSRSIDLTRLPDTAGPAMRCFSGGCGFHFCGN